VAFQAFIADSLGAVQVSKARPEYRDGVGRVVVEVVAALAVSAPPMSAATPAADQAA
jgi:hypothetical protein